jgi:hypothetical protein
MPKGDGAGENNMKSNTAIKTMVIAFIVMIGMTGLGAATQLNVTLENKNPVTWQPIADGISAVINYDSSGDDFVWSASGTAPLANTSYSLIYYADKPNRFVNWGGDNPGALIGIIMTTTSGSFDTGSMSVDLDMNLPCTPDANMNISEHNYCGAPDYYTHCTGAKLWMVPSAEYSEPALTAWNPANYLFETDLITYTDCDLYDTSPPANATIAIGDAFNNGSTPIAIINATNVGTVDITLKYNASIVTVTGVTNGDMDSIFYNIGTGQVNILTYQGASSGLNGDFDLVNVTFTPAGDGTCPFEIVVTSFMDATPCYRTMPYDIIEGAYCTYTNGDVTGDGVVNAGDVMYLAKHVVGITGFEDITCASDVDGSGTIDVNDVAYLAKHLIGITGYETLQ